MGSIRGHRSRGDSWVWESSPQPRRGPARWVAGAWTVPLALAVLAGLLLLITSFGGDAGRGSLPLSCGNASVQVSGALSGTVTWCAPAGAQVLAAEGIIAVQYAGNENLCHFAPEPGPGGGWFKVAGSYRLALSGPAIPGKVASAEWSYHFDGPFSLCGGENAMRVTVILRTNLAGATAWVKEFGAGAYGGRTDSFNPIAQTTPTPTPSTPPTATASPTPTPTSVATGSPAPTGSPSPTPLHTGTPTSAATPTGTPPPSGHPTATPSPVPTASPGPTPKQTPQPTATPTQSPTPSPTASPAPTVSATPTPTLSPTPSPALIPPWVMSPVPTALGASATPAPGDLPNGGGGFATGGERGVIVLALAGAFLMILSAGVLSWARRR